MRVMVLVKATKDSETGAMPSAELLAAMGQYNEELVKAGILLAGEGLQPSVRGKRVAFDDPSRTVIDGPFAETSEFDCRLLALAGQGHVRGNRMGEALPQSNARPERNRNPPSVRGRRLRRGTDAGARRTGRPDPRTDGRSLKLRPSPSLLALSLPWSSTPLPLPSTG